MGKAVVTEARTALPLPAKQTALKVLWRMRKFQVRSDSLPASVLGRQQGTLGLSAMGFCKEDLPKGFSHLKLEEKCKLGKWQVRMS